MQAWAKTIYLIFVILLLAGNPSFVNAQKKNWQGAKKTEMVLIKSAAFEMGTDKGEIPKLQEIFIIKRAAIFSESRVHEKSGDKAKSAKVYRQFQKVWINPDRDLPQIQEAEKWLK